MKRVFVAVMIAIVLMNVMPVQAQDNDCRSLMGQVDTLIGQAMTALENGDVETSQSLLDAAHTLAGLCLGESADTPDAAGDAWVEVSYDVTYGGVMSLAHPQGWDVFAPTDESGGVAGMFLFSSAETRDAVMNSEDGAMPPGEMVTRINVVPLEAVEGDYEGIVDAMQMVLDEYEGVQADAITETTFNDLPAAYVPVYDPEENTSSLIVLIEGESAFIMILGWMVEGDVAHMEQTILAIAESVVYAVDG